MARGIVDLSQMGRRFRRYDLKGRTNNRMAEMTGHRRAITLSNDDVEVQGGLILGRHGDVAQQGGDLDLLIHWDFFVFLFSLQSK